MSKTSLWVFGHLRANVAHREVAWDICAARLRPVQVGNGATDDWQGVFGCRRTKSAMAEMSIPDGGPISAVFGHPTG